MPEPLPATAVVRVAHVGFDPNLFDAVADIDKRSVEYLVPAIKRLPGLLHWFTGISQQGSFVQVSIWDTEEHADQMERLKEMAVDMRGELAAAGVPFTAENATRVNYPITWVI